MTIGEMLNYGQKKLGAVSATPFLDLELITGYVLSCTKEQLILQEDKALTEAQEQEIFNLLQRRQQSEPIAYLIQKKEFYGLDFYVDQNVLIPRPETEILVEAVIDYCRRNNFNTEKTCIVDVGTGSGCIAISLGKKLSKINLFAVDISQKSLAVARKNCAKYNLTGRIRILQNDLLTGLNFKKFENLIIAANLPYVEESAELMAGVKDYEPSAALFGGKDGVDFYRRLVEQLKIFQPKAFFCEIDPRQKTTLSVLMQANLPGYNLSFKKDLSGKIRILEAERW